MHGPRIMERSTSVGALGAGLGLGAALMFLADPVHGRRRRSRLRDRASSVFRRARIGVERSARDLQHRAHGAIAEARGALGRSPAADDVIAGRVRARLGRVASHPNALYSEVHDGHVTLSGPILADELEAVMRAISTVPGVHRIENRLEPHEQAGRVPGLQGPRRRRAPRAELLQTNWAPGPRLLVGVASALAIARGLKRRGVAGDVLALAAATALARAATNLPLSRLFGVGAGRRAVDFQKTLHVHRPVDEVFAWFADFRNFPRFMSHVRDVRNIAPRRWHWVVEGPAGVAFQWDGEVVALDTNRTIAWRTLPGAEIENAGVVQFEPDGDGCTRMTVRLSYNPPAGALGHAIAHLFGRDPKREMDDDLLRFKSLLEAGKATGRGEQVRRDDLPHRPM
jgi:uncharacterized membrane protein